MESTRNNKLVPVSSMVDDLVNEIKERARKLKESDARMD